MTEVEAAKEAPGTDEPTRSGAWLSLWASLTILIVSALWLTGFRTSALSEAVDAGAAKAEAAAVGEVSDDLIRKTIQTQRDTLPFWTVLAFLADVMAEPLALAIRALAAATVFSSVAALRGRRVAFEEGLNACAAAQGIWVLGLATRAGLMVALRRASVETSAALFLPAGSYPAVLWLGLRQLDAFAVVGWAVVAIGAVRRGQVGWFMAIFASLWLFAFEASIRLGLASAFGAGMRLTIMPAG